ncbi:MAG TPA: tyrosine/phenylalanine carboxypeptidase domain-containing protein, partial [Polyangiaceae bacterium]|nr:tyrosine/phenylalanine carboxypeptidase domain-containing protein [Polyangiaceae bacterium]
MDHVSIADTPGLWRSYKEKIARIAQQIVNAQQPIRVLDHIKWSPEVFEKFRESRWREPPQVGPEFYQQANLGFDPEAKKREFREIEKVVDRELGEKDAIGSILYDSAREYGLVVELLESRGTPRFYELSRRLYGSSRDRFADGVTEVRHVAHDFYDTLTNLDDSLLGPQLPRDIEAAEVVQILNQQLGDVFGDGVIRV